MRIPDNTTVLLHFNDALDSEITAPATTPALTSGAEVYTTGKSGKAVKLDGTRCVQIPYNSDAFGFTNQDWTAAGWFLREEISNDWTCLFSSRGRYNATNSTCGWSVSIDGENDEIEIFVATTYNQKNENRISNASEIFPVNVWTHFALVKNGEKYLLFINGKLELTVDLGTATVYNPAAPLNICGTHDKSTTPTATTEYLKGAVDEFIIVNGVALWTEDFNPEKEAIFTTNYMLQPGIVGRTNAIANMRITRANVVPDNTTVLLHFNDALDSEITAPATTPALTSGTEVYTTGKSEKAIKLDGTQCVQIPYNADAFGFTNQDWTAAGWFLREEISDDWVCLFSSRGRYNATNSARGWNVSVDGENNEIEAFVCKTYATNDRIVVSNASEIFPLNTWTHFALVKNSDTFLFFINGRLVGTMTFDTTTIYNPKVPLDVGGIHDKSTTPTATTEYLKGAVDEFIIVNGAALWTENFNPEKDGVFELGEIHSDQGSKVYGLTNINIAETIR